MRLRWTHRARQDLLDIGEYIARDSRTAARAWVDRLRRRARMAAEVPLAGRAVPEFGRKDVREVFLRTYRIVYEVRDDAVHVLTVFEGHKLLSPLEDEAEP